MSIGCLSSVALFLFALLLCRFMADLQTEILEQEFNEFSKGQNTITEVDFAKILLRYTHLDADA